MGRPPRIMISAGEASGDRLGAGLARALLERRPEIELFGMGGSQMQQAGVRVLQPSSEVAVVGFVEVLSRLPAIRRAMARLERSIADEQPDLLVPIDFPDFNLRLTTRARRAGCEVVYFVSPQVWAWRRGRVQTIRRLVRRMLVLFPFEKQFYEDAGVPVTFVGHPAGERSDDPPSREALCERAGLDPNRPVLALVPGSRTLEVARLLPPMLGALELLRRDHPRLQAIVPIAPGLPAEKIEVEIERAGVGDVRTHDADFPEILGVCRAGVVGSGTASLEAAIMELPMVVVYRISAVSAFIARRFVNLDDVALPNLVTGQRIVPELIQRDCTPERIAAELKPLIESDAAARAMRARLAEVRGRLGGPGVFGRAAEAILGELPG